jgi:hypothetical protein
VGTQGGIERGEVSSEVGLQDGARKKRVGLVGEPIIVNKNSFERKRIGQSSSWCSSRNAIRTVLLA